jgi:hypothetical protein
MATQTTAPAPDPAYFEVWVARVVTILGQDYKPGQRHVMDETTLALVPAEAIKSKRSI